MHGPTGITLFTYRVGFGDCFLLRFEYPRRPRHVLIDFGTTATPQGARRDAMLDIARDIVARCQERGGTLEAVVLTHRHQDHLSGFAGKPWAALRTLAPRLAVMPWTEHPDARVDARAAPDPQVGRLGARSVAHHRSLGAMQALAASALKELRARGHAGDGQDEESEEVVPGGRPFGKRLTEVLGFLGEDNLTNAEAVRNLLGLPARDYLCFGQPTRLAKVLPGVTVRVLGPPTLEQSEAVRGYARSNPEYWSFAARAVERSSSGKRLFPGVTPVPPSRLPLEARWFLERLDAVRGEQLLQLVRLLDDTLNNTSLILLFEACGKKLLFPGDAQVENWAHALSHPEVRALLAGVDLYKVGHHGSLNATPKTLWRLFEKTGAPEDPGTLRTVLSTRPGKHGSASSGTEVPRRPLVEALKASSRLFATTELTRQSELVHEERLAP